MNSIKLLDKWYSVHTSFRMEVLLNAKRPNQLNLSYASFSKRQGNLIRKGLNSSTDPLVWIYNPKYGTTDAEITYYVKHHTSRLNDNQHFCDN